MACPGRPVPLVSVLWIVLVAAACVDGNTEARPAILEGSIRLEVDPSRGTYSIGSAEVSSIAIRDATSTVLLETGALSASDLPSLSIGRTDAAEGTVVTLVSRGSGLPEIRTRFTWRPDAASVLIRAQVEASEDGPAAKVLGFRPLDCRAAKGCRAELGEDPGRASVLVNGYQSWSYSGVAAFPVGTIVEPDDELLRWGNNVDARVHPNLGWWYAALREAGGAALLAGATTTDLWKTAIVFEADPSSQPSTEEQGAPSTPALTRLQAWTGGTGDSLALEPGKPVSSEEIHVGIRADPLAALDEYARAAASRAPESALPSPPIGWTSWYFYFPAVAETDVLENAAFIRERGLLALGYDLIQVDDGWEVEWGDWRSNGKFPSGMDGLASTLTGLGHEMGIWIAPLLVEWREPLVAEHPDWFLRNAAGRPIVFVNGDLRVLRVLDPTHPEVEAWLAERFREIRSWGYTLLKVDFLFAGAYEGIHHDAGATSLSAYKRALAAMKRGAGEGSFFIASGAPHLPTAGIFQANRAGPDVCTMQFPPSWPLTAQELRDSFVRFAGHGLWFLDDPDAILVRPDLTLDEARAAVTAGALIGGSFLLGDRLSVLAPERLDLLARPEILEIVRAGNSAVPVDLFDEVNPMPLGPVFSGLEDVLLGGHTTTTRIPRIWSLDPGDGTRWVGAFNWRARAGNVRIDLARLGLDPGKSYTVREYWDGRDLGRVKGGLTLDQEKNSVDLLRIVP